jgi:hypothetical protein
MHKTTVYIINDTQIPIDSNKNSDQKLRNIQSPSIISTDTEKGKAKVPGT